MTDASETARTADGTGIDSSLESPTQVQSGLWLIVRRALRTGRGRVGAAVVLLVVAVAVFGPFLAPHSPSEIVSLPYDTPHSGLPLGTDVLGRDVLSRVLNGGWVLLVLAVLATSVGVLVGTTAGLVSAYLGGKVDAVVMRVVDILLALPQIIFALLLVSVAGPKPWLLIVAVGLSHAPQVARVLYAAAQDITERDFVRISRLWGVGVGRVLRRDVLPNLLGPLMVEFGLRLSYSVIILSGLSFLGFGRQPPAADWGLMVNENRLGIELAPLCVAAPAFMVALLAVGANTLGDAIARASLGDSRGEETMVAGAFGAVTS